MTNNKNIPEKALHLLTLTKNLTIEGFEKSFRMSENRVSWNRFLIGIEKKDINREELLSICDQMNMPTIHYKTLMDNYHDASQVLFGFEEREKSYAYKVYLEFWEKVKEEVNTKINKTEPLLLHIGLKWDIDNPARNAVSRYTCFPLLSEQGIIRRLSDIYDGYNDQTAFGLVKNIIKIASKKAPEGSFIYLEVGEDDNPRNSFDVNLYKANLSMEELYPFLSKLCEYYSISLEDFDNQYQKMKTQPFGHVAGGIDREGKDFLTFYYEDKLLSVIKTPIQKETKKIGRNEPCPCGSGSKYKKCCGK